MVTTPEEKDWIFISDAHFTGREPREIELFLGFLDLEKERMGHLVILGDLFEFFFGFKEVSSGRKPFAFADYLPVLEQLQALYHLGIRIKYFEGNHDFFLESFFSQYFEIEVEVHPEGWEEKLGGKRAYVAHGDLSNPEQWKYRAVRKVLKSRWTYGLVHLIGPGVTRRVARGLNKMSYRKYHGEVPSHTSLAFKRFAHQKFLEGFEIVILGHSHFPEQVEESIDGRRCLYFNVGDWVTHRSFLRFTPPHSFLLSRF